MSLTRKASCMAAGAAWSQTVLIRDADVYPVTGKEMKGVSVLIQDGKIAEIAAKIAAPKGVRVVEAKGLRVYPGMIDSGTELGLSEISSVRVVRLVRSTCRILAVIAMGGSSLGKCRRSYYRDGCVVHRPARRATRGRPGG